MKRKLIIFIIISVIAIFYFKPLQLSNLIDENEEILITQIELTVKNGEANNNSETYNDLTDEQKNSIITLFENYYYRRTFGTMFSDGSLSDLGDKLLHVYIYNGTTLVNSLSFSTTGDIVVNNKTYKMKNTHELIDKTLEIVKG